MIDAGTISASLVLDTAPFSNGIFGVLGTLAELGIYSSEQGESIGTLGEILAMVGSGVYTDFQVPFASAADQVSASSAIITGAVAGAAAAVDPSAKRIRSNILNPLRETVSEGTGIMANFGQGMINGLTMKQASLYSKAREIARGVSGTMKKALGIASPSRVMREVGRFTAEGMVLGLQDMSGEVENASKALAQSAVVSAYTDTGSAGRVQREYSEAVGSAAVSAAESAPIQQDILARKLDTLIDLLSSGRQSIELDRRTFGTLVREYA